MIAYRYRTPNRDGKKKRETDEQVDPAQFRAGLIVWVPDADGIRHEYICTGEGSNALPRDEYFKWKATQTAERVKKHRSRPRETRRGNHSDLIHIGIGGYY